MAVHKSIEAAVAGERLGRWLSTRFGAEVEISHLWIPPSSGWSAETFIFDAAWSDDDDAHRRALVARLEPVRESLFPWYDLVKEARVIEALGKRTDVAVPTIVGREEDPELLGAPFYVMEKVDGVPYRYAAELAPLGPERTRTISEGLVDTLGALHQVDPATVGLADFGRPEGFLARQVSRWKKQIDASWNRDLPAADELYTRLAADVPTESATGIVHGDYRLDNVLTDDRDRPAAVIDWEMATLGDPLTDLALMVVYGRLGALLQGNAVADATSAPGFLTEDEIIARYATHSDRDLSRFGFYLGLAAYKLAAILEGIHYRHLHGQTVGEGFADIGGAIHPLLDTGLTALKEYR